MPAGHPGGFGGFGGGFGPPYPLEPYELFDPLTGQPIGSIESTFDEEGTTRQIRDRRGKVLAEQTIPPTKAD